jgi:repressor LexA
MEKKPLTEKQKKVLGYLKDYMEKHGFAPAIREICGKFKFSSTRGAQRHLETLEEKGYIERKATARSIRIIQEATEAIQNVIRLPLVGHISAGSPILAEENIEDMIPISADFARNIDDAFLLRVKGDSMIGDGILHGDMVIVKPQPTARDGDIIVGLIGDEATVKRFFMGKGQVRLVPSNKKYRPLVIKENFRVIGRVLGVIRKY